MIAVRVLDVKPHPDQATNNPGTWAVKLRVSHDGKTRAFWRWHSVRELREDCRVTPSKRRPTHDEIVAEFWDNTFGDLHGFDFERDEHPEEATP